MEDCDKYCPLCVDVLKSSGCEPPLLVLTLPGLHTQVAQNVMVTPKSAPNTSHCGPGLRDKIDRSKRIRRSHLSPQMSVFPLANFNIAIPSPPHVATPRATEL